MISWGGDRCASTNRLTSSSSMARRRRSRSPPKNFVIRNFPKSVRGSAFRDCCALARNRKAGSLRGLARHSRHESPDGQRCRMVRMIHTGPDAQLSGGSKPQNSKSPGEVRNEQFVFFRRFEWRFDQDLRSVSVCIGAYCASSSPLMCS
jgi:hypothetical protein